MVFAGLVDSLARRRSLLSLYSQEIRMSLRRSISFANVTSMLALTVALGGTSYAAVTVTGKDVRNESLTGKDVRNKSLTGKDIKNGTVRGGDIRNEGVTSTDILNGSIGSSDIGLGSVNSGDIADGSLTAGDFRPGELPSGASGTSGPAGATGPAGKDGATGPAGKDGADGKDATGGASSSSVVNRTRSTGPTTPSARFTNVPVALRDNSWTQAADELDQLFGRVSITIPSDCDEFGSGATVTIFVAQDGGTPMQVGFAGASRFFGTGTSEVDVGFSRVSALFEPGSAVINEFSATFSDSCDTSRATLNSLKLDVIGTR